MAIDDDRVTLAVLNSDMANLKRTVEGGFESIRSEMAAFSSRVMSMMGAMDERDRAHQAALGELVKRDAVREEQYAQMRRDIEKTSSSVNQLCENVKTVSLQCAVNTRRIDAVESASKKWDMVNTAGFVLAGAMNYIRSLFI